MWYAAPMESNVSRNPSREGSQFGSWASDGSALYQYLKLAPEVFNSRSLVLVKQFLGLEYFRLLNEQFPIKRIHDLLKVAWNQLVVVRVRLNADVLLRTVQQASFHVYTSYCDRQGCSDDSGNHCERDKVRKKVKKGRHILDRKIVHSYER